MPRRRNRRLFSRTASEEEKTRVEFEKMGLDCKVARELAKKGIRPKELKVLAKGSAAEFIKKNRGKLSPEETNYLIEKYK